MCCQSEKREKWDVIVPLMWSCSFHTSGDPQNGLQVCMCGNWAEAGSDLGQAGEEGQWNTLFYDDSLAADEAKETKSFNLCLLCVIYMRKTSISSCDSPVSHLNFNSSFKCVLFACSPYKKPYFPELVFTSVEARHRHSLTDFRRGLHLNSLYLERALWQPR